MLRTSKELVVGSLVQKHACQWRKLAGGCCDGTGGAICLQPCSRQEIAKRREASERKPYVIVFTLSFSFYPPPLYHTTGTHWVAGDFIQCFAWFIVPRTLWCRVLACTRVRVPLSLIMRLVEGIHDQWVKDFNIIIMFRLLILPVQVEHCLQYMLLTNFTCIVTIVMWSYLLYFPPNNLISSNSNKIIIFSEPFSKLFYPSLS